MFHKQIESQCILIPRHLNKIKEFKPDLPIVAQTAYTTNEDKEKAFFEFATSLGMVGIKGHRSVGGFRASTYNALPVESVEALVSAMQEFEKENK